MELAWRLAANDQRPHYLTGAHKRHKQPRPVARAQDSVIDWRWRQISQISGLVGLVRFGQLADSFRNSGMHVADRRDHFFAHAVGRSQLKFLLLVAHVDRADLRAGQLGSLGNDRFQHDLQIER